MLITYIRKNKTEKSKGQPIGCVVALDKNHIGWSLKNEKDKWDKKRGLEIAKKRAEKTIEKKYDLFKNIFGYPAFDKVYPIYKYIEQKAEIYFKD